MAAGSTAVSTPDATARAMYPETAVIPTAAPKGPDPAMQAGKEGNLSFPGRQRYGFSAAAAA